MKLASYTILPPKHHKCVRHSNNTQRPQKLNEWMNEWSLQLVTKLSAFHSNQRFIKIYQIITAKCTHVFLNHHFINTTYNSNMFQPLKGHLQGIYLIHSSSITPLLINMFYLTSRILQLVIHFVGPHCYIVSITLPEDDPLRAVTCWSYV